MSQQEIPQDHNPSLTEVMISAEAKKASNYDKLLPTFYKLIQSLDRFNGAITPIVEQAQGLKGFDLGAAAKLVPLAKKKVPAMQRELEYVIRPILEVYRDPANEYLEKEGKREGDS